MNQAVKQAQEERLQEQRQNLERYRNQHQQNLISEKMRTQQTNLRPSQTPNLKQTTQARGRGGSAQRAFGNDQYKGSSVIQKAKWGANTSLDLHKESQGLNKASAQKVQSLSQSVKKEAAQAGMTLRKAMSDKAVEAKSHTVSQTMSQSKNLSQEAAKLGQSMNQKSVTTREQSSLAKYQKAPRQPEAPKMPEKQPVQERGR